MRSPDAFLFNVSGYSKCLAPSFLDVATTPLTRPDAIQNRSPDGHIFITL